MSFVGDLEGHLSSKVSFKVSFEGHLEGLLQGVLRKETLRDSLKVSFFVSFEGDLKGLPQGVLKGVLRRSPSWSPFWLKGMGLIFSSISYWKVPQNTSPMPGNKKLHFFISVYFSLHKFVQTWEMNFR